MKSNQSSLSLLPTDVQCMMIPADFHINPREENKWKRNTKRTFDRIKARSTNSRRGLASKKEEISFRETFLRSLFAFFFLLFVLSSAIILSSNRRHTFRFTFCHHLTAFLEASLQTFTQRNGSTWVRGGELWSFCWRARNSRGALEA